MKGKAKGKDTAMSPLEQQFIDGDVYWDRFGPGLWRLIDRRGMDTLGVVRQQYGFSGYHYDAEYFRSPMTYADRQPQGQEFQSEALAKHWIEERSAEAYSRGY